MPLIRRIVFVALLLVFAALPACSDDGADETMSGQPLLTMTDDGCTYEGDDTPTGPTFTVDTDNQSSSFVRYGVSRIPERYVEVERERIEEGDAFLINPPAYYSQISGGGIGSGVTGSFLVETATTGTYVLWCSTDAASDAVYVTSLLEVPA